MIYKFLIKPVLFLFDAETIHNYVLSFFSKATFLYPLLKRTYASDKNSGVEINGLHFKNALGLAAGFDKNGVAVRFWEAIGFSHAEIGTVTPLSQPGNEKPRIFRLKKDEAIINRLGFNNKGADEVRRNLLEARKYTGKDFVIGVNIGKNKHTPVKDAVHDYKICFEKLYDVADYFTINISSPNTEGLRMLHEEIYLDNLLQEIQTLNKHRSESENQNAKNIFLKVAPDLNDALIESIFKLSLKNKITGIIATNTTVERIDLKSNINEQGGLSGKPLSALSNKVLKRLSELNNKMTAEVKEKPLILIGVGGVFSKQDFEFKIDSGASIVQVYTGFIYEGPGILKKIFG